jgi:tripartite-type tricarboxylate transporter receptor subunit TctC
MDPKVVKKLADTFKAAMADPEHVKKMSDVGLAVKVMTGDEYTKYYEDLHKKAIKYTEWAKKEQK